MISGIYHRIEVTLPRDLPGSTIIRAVEDIFRRHGRADMLVKKQVGGSDATTPFFSLGQQGNPWENLRLLFGEDGKDTDISPKSTHRKIWVESHQWQPPDPRDKAFPMSSLDVARAAGEFVFQFDRSLGLLLTPVTSRL